MPPLPGLRASSLPPAPGYDSDEEGGLCNKDKAFSSVRSRKNEKKERNATIAIANPPVVARQRPRGLRGNRATRSFETPVPPPPPPSLLRLHRGHVRGRKGCFAFRRANCDTVAVGPSTEHRRRLTGGPPPPPGRFRSRLKAEHTYHRHENAHRINDRGRTRDPYESIRAPNTVNILHSLLDYSTCVAGVIISPSQSPFGKIRTRQIAGPVRGIPLSTVGGEGGGLPIHRWQPNCSVSVLFVR